MSNPFDAESTAYDEVHVSVNSGDGVVPSNETTTTTTTTTNTTGSFVETQTKQQISNAYEATTDDFRTANQAVADHNAPPETPTWVSRCFNWMPLRWFLFVAGLALSFLAVLDMAINGTKVKGIGDLVFFYIFCIGFVIMIVEAPVFTLTRGCQLGLFFWFRLLSRLWGRSWFYLFISLLCFAQLPGLVTATVFGGIYLVILIPIMLVVSRTSAQKYQRIYVFVAAGAEKEERDRRFEQKFDDLDTGKTGFISSNSIVTLAAQAGRTLSNAERNAIQTFLDASCNGKVSKEDFVKQFRDYNLKQRFL